MAEAYDIIWPVVERELAARAARSEKLAIHILDGNHFSALPHVIASHPRLIEIARRYGTPASIREAVPSLPSNIVAAFYYGAEEAQREGIRASTIEQSKGKFADPAEQARYEAVQLENLDNINRGVPLYYPDPRTPPTALSSEQSAAVARYSKSTRHIAPQCDSVAESMYETLISEQERDLLAQGLSHYTRMALDPGGEKTLDTSITDRTIAERMGYRFDEPIGEKGGLIPIARRTIPNIPTLMNICPVCRLRLWSIRAKCVTFIWQAPACTVIYRIMSGMLIARSW